MLVSIFSTTTCMCEFEPHFTIGTMRAWTEFMKFKVPHFIVLFNSVCSHYIVGSLILNHQIISPPSAPVIEMNESSSAKQDISISIHHAAVGDMLS